MAYLTDYLQKIGEISGKQIFIDGTKIEANAGYESEGNYSFLEDNKLTAIIKPSNYEQSKKKKYKNNIGLAENMEYDAANDCYICKAGKLIEYTGDHTRHNKDGYEKQITLYECRSCDGCPYKCECILGSNWKIPEED